MRALTRRRDAFPHRVFNDDMFDVFNDMFGFDNMLAPLFGSTNGARANVMKTDSGCSIEIEAPGMTKDDFKIEIDDGTLTVSAHAEKKKETASQREFYLRSFKRSWTLPDGVKEEDIGANYDAGILRLHVPIDKPPNVEKKQIRTIDIT